MKRPVRLDALACYLLKQRMNNLLAGRPTQEPRPATPAGDVIARQERADVASPVELYSRERV